MTSKKITKVEFIYAITEHFKKEGKRMSNLSKATIPQLESVVKKKNINIDIHLIKREEDKKINKMKEKQEEEEIKQNNLKNELIAQKIKELTANFEYNTFVKKYAVIYQLNHKFYNENNKEEILMKELGIVLM